MSQISKTVAVFLLRGYKWAISPMFLPACRYVPSCSEYAMEAIDRYGVARGSVMAVWRVLRCHPFARGGLDPVIKLEVSKPTRGVPVQSGGETELCSH
jgi:putative membrane protein insertion efficiency factor